MSKYSFTLTGETPLLMHADDVEASDTLMAWRKNSDNKSLSVPGDDRSPAWTWHTYLYSDGENVCIPSDNIMVALRNAGSKMIHKKQETYKKLTQSGLVILDEHCELIAPRNPVPMASIAKLRDKSFAEQSQAVKSLGFTLFTKRAKLPSSGAKNVRVRPRFEEWSVRGDIEVLDPAITPEVLVKLFDIAGAQSGLGDWRPSSPKSPGPFGRFSAKVSISK